MNKPMKPAISYYGGKQRMASKIVPLIPQHTVYVEPFCGGATVLFAKPWPKTANNNDYREVINDVDGRLVNFYKQMRENGEELVRRIQLTPCSEAEYQESLREGLECEDKLEAARRYFLNISQSFSNKLNGGWRHSVFSRNEAATWAGRIGRLPEYIDRMSSVQVACQDALKIIERYDSPQTFFYCDPPYPNTSQGHYSGYSMDDYKALIAALDNTQGSFILSNYDHAEADVPLDWERFEFGTHCGSNGKGRVNADRSRKATDEELGDKTRKEIVYRRFNRVPVRPEIKKLYDSGAFDCFVRNPKE